MTLRRFLHRLISRFRVRRHTADSAGAPTSGGKGRRRRRSVPLPIYMERVTGWEKVFLVLMIVLFGFLLFKKATQEPPRSIEVVSPDETTFTPPK